MTDKPARITSGPFELAQYSAGYYLHHADKEKGITRVIGPASWGEFLELAKEILRHEIEENSTIDNDPCSYFDSKSS